MSIESRSFRNQGFLTLWKEADPGIPILNQAKAEYAKLTVTDGPRSMETSR